LISVDERMNVMENYELLTGFADEIAQELDAQIDGCKGLGIHYIEMRGVDGNNLIFHDDAKVGEIKKRLEDAGIRLSALGSPLGKIGIEDPFAPHFEDFKRAVEIAHRMDTKNIRMFSFYLPKEEEEKEVRSSAVRDEVFERLGRFADYAKANDAVLLHENEKGIYGDRAKECREIMDTFYGDHFKAVFDFANFVQVGQDTLEAYELMKDYIAYIHVKDAIKGSGKVVPVGFGDGNVKEILTKLFASGFKGFLSLEPHLFEFDGLGGLQREGHKIPTFEEGKKLTGLEAFTLAHTSLMNLLREID
jgi:sugar phosphate isomerase/epimerase